jgi:hypothetical protein
MERYIRDANIAHYRHLIAESERNPKRDGGSVQNVADVGRSVGCLPTHERVAAAYKKFA